MPLDRDHITAASRVMLPAYVIFFGCVALSFVLTPLDRLKATPSLQFADQLVSLRVWGLLYLTASLLMAAALIRRQRDWFRFALALCFLLMLVWAVILLGSAIAAQASWSAWTWPGLVACACYASYRSLTKRET